jgi:hypothetical protein
MKTLYLALQLFAAALIGFSLAKLNAPPPYPSGPDRWKNDVLVYDGIKDPNGHMCADPRNHATPEVTTLSDGAVISTSISAMCDLPCPTGFVCIAPTVTP